MGQKFPMLPLKNKMGNSGYLLIFFRQLLDERTFHSTMALSFSKNADTMYLGSIYSQSKKLFWPKNQ